ncbi:MAG: hypothetical protein NT068_04110 [Candidatus Nomurabacteria bacterium]|nr:hypothetical protein [Candidatus Nomurabacteria bacterium]
MNKFFKQFSKVRLLSLVIFSVLIILGTFYIGDIFPSKYSQADVEPKIKDNTLVENEIVPEVKIIPLDTVAYDLKLKQLANYPIPKPVVAAPVVVKKTDTKSTTGKIPIKPAVVKPIPVPKPNIWPVKAVYPNSGALLPFNRIIAYYGNFYSKKMGVLGEYPEVEMISKLNTEMEKWRQADPTTPVIPAIDYIAITAQGSAGSDGKYRFRMPDKQTDIAIALAKKVNGIVILDIQVGLSNLQTELPLLEKYLKMPEVHLAIDPEFSMKTGKAPGKVIGTFDATDVNYAAEYLAKLVKENNLTPKILIVHRFTEKMVTNYKNIKPLPEVQMVMDMDGWGGMEKKKGTYKYFIQMQPVQFTGFKLFYKNDLQQEKKRMMTPEEVMKLQPQPSFIQYQ